MPWKYCQSASRLLVASLTSGNIQAYPGRKCRMALLSQTALTEERTVHGSNRDGVLQAVKREHRHSGGRDPHAVEVAKGGVAVVAQDSL